jgi:hypothetical protein
MLFLVNLAHHPERPPTTLARPKRPLKGWRFDHSGPLDSTLLRAVPSTRAFAEEKQARITLSRKVTLITVISKAYEAYLIW